MQEDMPDLVQGVDFLTCAAVPDDVNPLPESAGFASQQLSQPEVPPFAPQLALRHCTAACCQLVVSASAFCNPPTPHIALLTG